jgi:F-type H+-transporting ATPase subunit gamma
MPSTREIRRRIRSVKNLAQITRAMEMVSASKMRRAQRNVLATRPYADRVLVVMGLLTGRGVGLRRGTLLDVRPVVLGVALIFVTPDRGLAGSRSFGAATHFGQRSGATHSKCCPYSY